MRSLGWFAVVISLTISSAPAQSPAADPNDAYLVLATARTSTMQKELDEAARQGFRVITGLPKGDEIVLCLERSPQMRGSYEYLLLATNRTSTMERELIEAGKDGYRLLPQTAIHKGDEVVVIMERSTGDAARYDYRLLATHRTSTLQNELNEVSRDGFVLRGTLHRDENLAILERRIPDDQVAQ